jgi:putative tryptophan/tyrosine transport system substrate-binding protein
MIGRREFIGGLGGTTLAWPLAARAQQPALPVIGFLSAQSLEGFPSNYMAAFHAGLGEFGYAEGRNVSVDYNWLAGQFGRVPALVDDLVRRRVAAFVIVAGTAGPLAAKAATATIPVVFAVGDDPVRLGLVASLARPGGNLTGMNFFSQEAVPKRLGFLHDLVPKADPMAVLVNPSDVVATKGYLRQVEDGAGQIGLPIKVFKAGNSPEIEAAFETMARDRIQAVFVAGDGYFFTRRAQFVALAARHGIPASFDLREFVEAGGLMSYGTDHAEVFHQLGVYTSRILKGAKPDDLPVVQTTKFEFALNLKTAKALGIEVPPKLLVQPYTVIE